jgi:hypothetical protein
MTWSEGRRNGADDERGALHVLLEKLTRVVNENRARIEELERNAQPVEVHVVDARKRP